MSNNQPTWDFSVYDLGFPRQAPDTSTAARKAAVAFENSVRNDVVENGAFFKWDGTVILQKVGLPDRIPFSPAELARGMNSLFTHNHPGGLSFSPLDIQIAILYRLTEIRAVSPGWRHIMRPTASWPSRSAIVAAIGAVAQRAHANIHAMQNSGQLSNRFANLELQHQIWLLVSRSLKLDYSREAS
jgi:hypothetical protein